MRAVLTNFGTTGDIQPLLALAGEMKRHGHEPILAFSPYFSSRVEPLGYEFVPLGPELEQLQSEANAALMRSPDSSEAMLATLAPLTAALPQVFAELSNICDEADVLISGPAQPAGRMVHETRMIPFVSVQFSHFGGIGNPALQRASASLINPYRAQLGLLPLRNPLTIDANSAQLALYAMSRHVLPPPRDWPDHYHMTGYFFMDDEGWHPDVQLLRFMNAGEPPIVISFGSMAHENPVALTELLLEAVGRAGYRALIQHGWSGIAQRELPSHVMAIGYVPHAWLFPRAKGIVHHGGGGTAGAVFRSGVPSVFIPHGRLFDQYYWAALAVELGCACPAIPYEDLSVERLSAAIKQLVTTPSYYRNAAALGEKVRAEPGVVLARQLIERLVQHTMAPRSERQGPSFDNESALARQAGLARRRQYQQEQRARNKRRTPLVK